ncbi:hypothetical protein PROFUN_03575 [Planoprotostelium fungivorum]|uniref:Uncharacterized protein n=1 Tax=Planoprotostelium fungivorum TaxID=1890364 RepID=A0A2P6MSH9_9EUKA|nr:hypothetical protein PROFUN_03575 [Planoprotostelium fungivorum]
MITVFCGVFVATTKLRVLGTPPHTNNGQISFFFLPLSLLFYLFLTLSASRTCSALSERWNNCTGRRRSARLLATYSEHSGVPGRITFPLPSVE